MAEGIDSSSSTDDTTDSEKWKALHLDRFLNDTMILLNDPIQNDMSEFEKDLMSSEEFQKRTVKINNMIARRQGKLPSSKSENELKEDIIHMADDDPIRHISDVPLDASTFSAANKKNCKELLRDASATATATGILGSDDKRESSDKTSETLKQFTKAELPSYLIKVKKIEKTTRSIRHTLEKFDRSNKYDTQLNANIRAYMLSEDENERNRLYAEIIKKPAIDLDLSGTDDESSVNKKGSDTIQVINISTTVTVASDTDIKSKNIVNGTSKHGSRSSRVNSLVKYKN